MKRAGLRSGRVRGDDRPDHHAFDLQRGSGEVDGDRPVALVRALRTELHCRVGNLDVASEERLVADACHDYLSGFASGVLAHGDEISGVDAERVHGVVGDGDEERRGWVESFGHLDRHPLDDAVFGEDLLFGADRSEAYHGEFVFEDPDPARCVRSHLDEALFGQHLEVVAHGAVVRHAEGFADLGSGGWEAVVAAVRSDEVEHFLLSRRGIFHGRVSGRVCWMGLIVVVGVRYDGR